MKRSLFFTGLLLASANSTTFCADADDVAKQERNAKIAEAARYITTGLVAGLPLYFVKLYTQDKADVLNDGLLKGTGAMVAVKMIEKPAALRLCLLLKSLDSFQKIASNMRIKNSKGTWEDATTIYKVGHQAIGMGAFGAGFYWGSKSVDAGNYVGNRLEQWLNGKKQ